MVSPELDIESNEVINHDDFIAIYDLYGRELLRYVFSRVKDQYVAEDIVQELFLSLWKNRFRLHEIVNIKAYLYSAAKYLVVAHLYKNRERDLEIDVLEIDILDGNISIEDRLHYRYLLDLLHSEVENLPEKCRLVFVASRFHNKSIKEIAEIYAISESTVENHINKALGKLKRIKNQYLTILPYFF